MFDRLSKKVKRKIEMLEESGMDYWIVRVQLKDGRQFSNVVINGYLRFGFPDLVPFRMRDIEEVEWDGYRGNRSSGEPMEILGESLSNGESFLPDSK